MLKTVLLIKILEHLNETEYFQPNNKNNSLSLYDAPYNNDKTTKFFGVWKKMKPSGLGILSSVDSLEIADFHEGNINGIGRKYFMNGNLISGNFINNQLNGSCQSNLIKYSLSKLNRCIL